MPTQSSDVSRFRKIPRPSFYNASSGTTSEISVDFETWLIFLSNAQKQDILSRLRRMLKPSPGRSARDALLRVALNYQARSAGAIVTELNTGISGLSTDLQSALSDSVAPEIGMLLGDMSRANGELVFARDCAENTLTATSFASQALESGTSNQTVRRQIGSWIEIITQYLLPGG